jgi:uncharacterized protein (TIGR02217 family)
MSTAVFPSLIGQAWDINRTPIWDTTIETNVSGKEVRLSNFTSPRYQWDISYNALRQGTVHNIAYTEFSQLLGFYNARQGAFDSFLYNDSDDNSVTTQAIGTGDGTTKAFQLVRALGGFSEPVFAPNVVSAVYVDGVLKTADVDYTVSSWGSANSGVITFVTAPANTKAVTADFTYYWPCRFLNDSISFNKFISNMYEGKKLSIISLKS